MSQAERLGVAIIGEHLFDAIMELKKKPHLAYLTKNQLVNLAFVEFCNRQGVDFKMIFKSRRDKAIFEKLLAKSIGEQAKRRKEVSEQEDEENAGAGI